MKITKTYEIGPGVFLEGADLGHTDLSETDLRGSRLVCVNLEEAIMDGMDTTTSYPIKTSINHSRLLGAKARNAKFDEASFYGSRMLGADFEGSSLRNTNLKETYLGGTNLRNTDLEGAKLQRATLYGTDLRGANLLHTDMTKARIDGMILDDGLGNEYVIG